MSRFEPLVDVVRGGLVESVHNGAVVLLDSSGNVTHSLGEIDTAMFPRSSSKLFQATAMVKLGLKLPANQLALVAASHSGGDQHVAVVNQILQESGLTESDLACTPFLPSGAAERHAYVATGGVKASVRSDCSGKHAGFLATCVLQGWELDNYLDPTHPLQLALKAEVEAVTEDKVFASSVDGCGAPLWAITLQGLARGFHKAVKENSDSPLRMVADAMREFPELVGGPGREATVAMQALDGVLAKDGADGVFAMAHRDGRAAAIKIGDGGVRAVAPVVAAVLKSWGAQPAAIAHLPFWPVLGGGQPMGSLNLNATAQEKLGL